MSDRLSAPLIRWEAEKGYGFLRVGKRDVFVHIRDFAIPPPRVALGDIIHFTVGTDSQGRTCATRAVHSRTRDGRPAPSPEMFRPGKARQIEPGMLLFLLVLLVAPILALHKRALHPGATIISAVALSAITYLTYALDKTRAQTRDWRIPEAFLHFLAFLGGWPGALLAQQSLRHKTVKVRFQIVFWLTIFVWQCAAIDYVLDWKFSSAAWQGAVRWFYAES